MFHRDTVGRSQQPRINLQLILAERLHQQYNPTIKTEQLHNNNNKIPPRPTTTTTTTTTAAADSGHRDTPTSENATTILSLIRD